MRQELRRKPHSPRLYTTTLYNPIQRKALLYNTTQRIMEKKQYQQPMTVSTQLEPNGILCVSVPIIDDPGSGGGW